MEQVIDKQEKIDIGIATLVYDEEGLPLTGHFDALYGIDAGADILSGLLKIDSKGKEENVLHNAQSLMAAWFVGVEHIELADRTEQQIVSEIISCDKYKSGMPSEVVIKFSLASV